METTHTPMKADPDALNEVHDLAGHRDPARCQVTPLVQLPEAAALAVTEALTAVVRDAHRSPAATSPDAAGITRAQTFEEGDVYMTAPPYPGYFADRYLMDFYDTEARGICSRMHLHTGLRFVRMMTGPATHIRVSSLAPLDVARVQGVTPFELYGFVDSLRLKGTWRTRMRHNLVVPPCSWVDMQVPAGVSHQFNARGPHAVIDSVHPEESIETLREHMTGIRMTAQTVFLAHDRPPASDCELP